MTHPDSTVERVANALFAVYETGVAWGDAPEEVRFLMRALARAALDAMGLPSREQIAHLLHDESCADDDCGGGDLGDYDRIADAILALFEQNGAEHE